MARQGPALKAFMGTAKSGNFSVPSVPQPPGGSNAGKQNQRQGPPLKSFIGAPPIGAPMAAKPQGGTKKQVPTKASQSIKGGGQAGGKIQGGTKTLIAPKGGRLMGGGQAGGKLQGGTKTQTPKSKGSKVATSVSVKKSLRNSHLAPQAGKLRGGGRLYGAGVSRAKSSGVQATDRGDTFGPIA